MDRETGTDEEAEGAGSHDPAPATGWDSRCGQRQKRKRRSSGRVGTPIASDVGTRETLCPRRDVTQCWFRPRSFGAGEELRRRLPATRVGTGADGFAILEVVIAFTMLVIILIPAAALFATVIGVSANARDRVEAGNLAGQQIDVGRATAFATLAAQATGGTAQTTIAKEGGITYTVEQSAAWVNESTNACGGTGDGAAGTQPILAMTETVTWPDMGSTHPVVAQTDVAPPAGYYSSSLANLAVNVVDSNNAPVVGASVTITGPSPATTVAAGPLSTGATGCAFAAFLEPGAYSISATLPGYVDMDENLTATKSNLAIGTGSTVGWTLNYAPAAQVPISSRPRRRRCRHPRPQPPQWAPLRPPRWPRQRQPRRRPRRPRPRRRSARSPTQPMGTPSRSTTLLT